MPSDPLFINASTGAPAYAADELRRSMAVLLYPGGTADRLGGRAGVRTAGAAALFISGSTVTVRDNPVVVYPGLSSTDGPYLGHIIETQHVLDPADTNPRIDLVIMRVYDHDHDASGRRELVTEIVKGTPAVTPVRPAVPTGATVLGSVDVPPSPGTPVLHNESPFAVANGGILPVRDATELPVTGQHGGMFAFDLETHQMLVWLSGGPWSTVGNPSGYQFGGRIVFHPSGGTFTKANFPGLRAVDVTVVGGGGGSGGVGATGASEGAEAGGGGGGGYGRAFILASALGAVETVTVGAGGAGATAGANNGVDGGSSTFTIATDTDLSATGGGGGAGCPAITTNIAAAGGARGIATGPVGSILGSGSVGGNGVIIGGESLKLNAGGGGGGGFGGEISTVAFQSIGAGGSAWGGGGSGPRNNDSAAAQGGRPGGAGGVIVELYY